MRASYAFSMPEVASEDTTNMKNIMNTAADIILAASMRRLAVVLSIIPSDKLTDAVI